MVVAKYVGLEGLDAGSACRGRESREQLRADAMSLGDVRHGEGDLGVSRPPGIPDVTGDADEPAGELRDQRGALMPVAGDEPFHFAISRSRNRKKPKVGTALRKAVHQVMQGVAVVRPHWPDEDRRAIPEDDVVLGSVSGVDSQARHRHPETATHVPATVIKSRTAAPGITSSPIGRRCGDLRT